MSSSEVTSGSDASVAVLRIVASSDAAQVGRIYDLTAGTVTLGRDESCDVTLEDDAVSRRHAELLIEGEEAILSDLGSANGVWLGEEKVERCELASGTVFRIGFTELELVMSSPVEEKTLIIGPGEGHEQTMIVAPEDSEPAASPAGLLASGDRRTVGAKDAFLLDDPERAWIVVSGKVEIFTVRTEDGRPVGERSHYLTVRPGEALLGMDLERFQGADFLAVPGIGTELSELTRSRLRELAETPDLSLRDRPSSSSAGSPSCPEP